MRSGLAVAIFGLGLSACGSERKNFAPTPVPIPTCQANQTATIYFHNAASTSTHSVLLDGVLAATLSPGQRSPVQTVAANVAHEVEFRVTNSNPIRRACSTSKPVWSVCSENSLSCNGD